MGRLDLRWRSDFDFGGAHGTIASANTLKSRLSMMGAQLHKMQNQYQPLYKWRHTWPGEGYQDFTGFDGDHSFGRIRLDETSHGKTGMWKWNITHVPWVREHIMPHSGWEKTSREACHKAEEHYEKLLELHGRPKSGR